MLIKRHPLTDWTKSSYSAVNGDCVEVKAADNSTMLVRDSKVSNGAVLGLTAGAWSAFLNATVRGAQSGA